jgi:hypothetical protein
MSAPTATSVFFLDDLVTVHPAARGKLPADAVYRVVATPGGSRTKYLVENVADGSRISGHPGAFVRHEGPAPEAAAPLAPLQVGAVVRAEAGHKLDPAALYVVLGTKADGGVKLVRLGGEGGRYWPSVRRRWLTEVDAAPLVAVAAG